MESIHDLWPTAATYQRELKRDVRHRVPGQPRRERDFILEGWTEMPPYRRDFDTLKYSSGPSTTAPGAKPTTRRSTWPSKWAMTRASTPMGHRSPRGDTAMLYHPDRSQYPPSGPTAAGYRPHARASTSSSGRARSIPASPATCRLELTLCGDEMVRQDPRRLSPSRLREANGAAHLHPVLPDRLPHLRAGARLQRILLRRRRSKSSPASRLPSRPAGSAP